MYNGCNNERGFGFATAAQRDDYVLFCIFDINLYFYSISLRGFYLITTASAYHRKTLQTKKLPTKTLKVRRYYLLILLYPYGAALSYALDKAVGTYDGQLSSTLPMIRGTTYSNCSILILVCLHFCPETTYEATPQKASSS